MIVHPNGVPANPYREPTIAELNSTDPKTPRRESRVATVTCPNGVVLEAQIKFNDGEQVTNLMRAVIAMEPPNPKTGQGGKCLVMMTRFHNEIGKVVYEVAECCLGTGGTNGEVTD
ncbi:MAG: hypothetical protein V3T08_09815 [Gemmatimonadota bacterium]